MRPIRLLVFFLVPLLASFANESQKVTIRSPDKTILAKFAPDARFAGVEYSGTVNLSEFTPLINLVSLDLNVRGISGESALDNLALESLYIQGVKNIPAKNIGRITTLQYLSLQNTGVTDGQMEMFSSLKKLIMLSLVETGITRLDFLKNHPELRRLYLTGSGISSLEGIRHCPDISEIYIGNTAVSDILLLGESKSLVYLEVPQGVDDKQIQKLRKLLPDLKIIKY